MRTRNYDMKVIQDINKHEVMYLNYTGKAITPKTNFQQIERPKAIALVDLKSGERLIVNNIKGNPKIKLL